MLWIVVTGSREVRDTPENRAVIAAELENLTASAAGAHLVVGDARGTDTLVLDLWRSPLNPDRENYRRFVADWDRHGRKAGPLRNREMIWFANAQAGRHECLVFFQTGAQNVGSADCANRARRAGFNVKEIWLK